MNKFIFADIKRLKKRYRSRLFAVSVPFLQFDIVISLIILKYSRTAHTSEHNAFLLKLLAAGFGALFVVVLTGVIISECLVSFHKRNTFMDITRKTLVISRHSQAYLNKFKVKYYKQLYIIDLAKLTEIRLVKGKIFVKGEIRCLCEKSDWLYYSFSERGIAFDKWWYDLNSGETLTKVEIPDFFKNTADSMKLVRRLSRIEKERIERHKQYHEQMLALAKRSVLQKQRVRKMSDYRRNVR